MHNVRGQDLELNKSLTVFENLFPSYHTCSPFPASVWTTFSFSLTPHSFLYRFRIFKDKGLKKWFEIARLWVVLVFFIGTIRKKKTKNMLLFPKTLTNELQETLTDWHHQDCGCGRACVCVYVHARAPEHRTGGGGGGGANFCCPVVTTTRISRYQTNQPNCTWHCKRTVGPFLSQDVMSLCPFLHLPPGFLFHSVSCQNIPSAGAKWIL